jgi:hypothetical protein
MPHTIRARLSHPIDAADLSRIWEAHVNLHDGPELLFSVTGSDVAISYPSQPTPRGTEKLRRAFEEALRTFDPDVRVEWQEAT